MHLEQQDILHMEQMWVLDMLTGMRRKDVTPSTWKMTGDRKENEMRDKVSRSGSRNSVSSHKFLQEKVHSLVLCLWKCWWRFNSVEGLEVSRRYTVKGCWTGRSDETWTAKLVKRHHQVLFPYFRRYPLMKNVISFCYSSQLKENAKWLIENGNHWNGSLLLHLFFWISKKRQESVPLFHPHPSEFLFCLISCQSRFFIRDKKIHVLPLVSRSRDHWSLS